MGRTVTATGSIFAARRVFQSETACFTKVATGIIWKASFVP
jgi:hypothetical protein